MQASLRKGEQTCQDIVKNSLARIGEINPALNAFCFTFPEMALEEAASRDDELANGNDRGPLHGIPVAIKDFTPTKGQVTTRGSFALENWKPEHDPVLVQRLKSAGAIIVGKTTTPEFAHSGFTNSLRWGITRNPHDPTRTSGGSSGGAAVAVATGCVPLAEGTDMGGSVRIPASCCGTVGFKPSLGRIPMDILPSTFDRISHFGLLTNHVEDVRLSLKELEGYDAADHTSQRMPTALPAELSNSVNGRKIAYSVDLGMYHVDREISDRMLEIVEIMRRAGAEMTPVEIGWNPQEVYDTWSDYWAVFLASVAGQYLEEFQDSMDPDLVSKIKHAETLTAVRMFEIERQWTSQWRKFRRAIEGFDALLCPTMAQPPAVASSKEDDHYKMDDNNRLHSLDMTVPFNCIGRCPVISLPCGRSTDGLPIGIQIVGHPYEDPTILEIASGLEALAFFQERPFPNWDHESAEKTFSDA